MKLAVTNTQRYEWDDEERGKAEVVEACCNGFPVGMSFAILRKHGAALYVSFQVEYDDAVDVPFTRCPSCGAPVEVVSWEPEREYERSVIYSGDVKLATGLPFDGQWSGGAVTYGTLPHAEEVNDGE